ncbi:MAG: YceH family protein [Acidimicrobiales bacterium]
MELSVEELRVVGALIEKQLTTPQQYPLTLNALLAACNQTSNREPVVTYGEMTLESALATLKSRGLLRFVHPSQGRSATRYRQVMEEVLGLDNRQLALVAVLSLRGPQTVGELRGRTERMARFSDLGDVETELDRLSRRDEPLVMRLPRQAGQKEERYAQLLCRTPVLGVTAGGLAEHDVPAAPSGTAPAAGAGAPSTSESVLGLEVAALRAELAALRLELDEIRAQIATMRG